MKILSPTLRLLAILILITTTAILSANSCDKKKNTNGNFTLLFQHNISKLVTKNNEQDEIYVNASLFPTSPAVSDTTKRGFADIIAKTDSTPAFLKKIFSIELKSGSAGLLFGVHATATKNSLSFSDIQSSLTDVTLGGTANALSTFNTNNDGVARVQTTTETKIYSIFYGNPKNSFAMENNRQAVVWCVSTLTEINSANKNKSFNNGQKADCYVTSINNATTPDKKDDIVDDTWLGTVTENAKRFEMQFFGVSTGNKTPETISPTLSQSEFYEILNGSQVASILNSNTTYTKKFFITIVDNLTFKDN